MIRAVAVDLDGTLLRSDCALSPRTRTALERLRGAGIPVIVCTGRSLGEARLALGGAPVCRYMVLLTGAQVYNRETARFVWTRRLSPETAAWAVTALTRCPEIFFQAYSGDTLYTTPEKPGLLPRCGLAPGDLEMTRSTLRVERELPALVREGRLPVEKLFSLALRRQDLDALRARLACGPALSLTGSFGNSLEIMAPETDKGRALGWVLAQMGYGPQEVLALGDSENDLSMLSAVGCPVAMGNAVAEVLALCGRVTGSNDEDGAAAVLERLY